MNKPNRHKNHILETESNKFFHNQVPNEWYVDKPDYDYGVDFVTNIVINNSVTGLNFSVQLKAKEHDRNIDFVSITMKSSTLGLYNTRLEPVLLVGYIREENEAYWLWYDDLNINLTIENKTVKIRIPKTNKLSSINWNDIIKYVQNRFSIKTLIDGIKSLEYNEISNSEILGWKNYYAGDFENSAFYFKNLLRSTHSNNLIILEGLAHSQYMLYNYSEALQNINNAIELSGTPNQFLTKACILAEDGIANSSRGKLIEAKNIFKEFIDKDSLHGEYHYNFANTLRSLGEINDSIKHYQLCLKLNPNYAEAWKNLGSVYYEIHAHEEEMTCYNNALKINPNLSEALFSKGITLSSIYNKHLEGLNLMMEAMKKEADMISNYPTGYFWIASANEKLKKLNESLYYINKGLSISPENKYMLDFKSNLLASNWNIDEKFNAEAVRFFEYRLELENDCKSLYHLIKIKDISDKDIIINLIKRHTHMLKSSSLKTLEDCNLDIGQFLSFLKHYDKYCEFRSSYPIIRYLDQIISELYSISTNFWEVIDLIFANAFSEAVSEYYKSSEIKLMGQKILDNISIVPNTLLELIPKRVFTREEAVLIFSKVYDGFFNAIIREFGAQFGFLTGKLGLEKIDPESILSEQWLDDLITEILLKTNQRLNLFENE